MIRSAIAAVAMFIASTLGCEFQLQIKREPTAKERSDKPRPVKAEVKPRVSKKVRPCDSCGQAEDRYFVNDGRINPFTGKWVSLERCICCQVARIRRDDE